MSMFKVPPPFQPTATGRSTPLAQYTPRSVTPIGHEHVKVFDMAQFYAGKQVQVPEEVTINQTTWTKIKLGNRIL
jgi:hypothetical protein